MEGYAPGRRAEGGVTVFGPYRGLFQVPGARGFVVTGFVGRMPMSMLGIGVILLIETLTGSYATAGAVAATFSIAFAVAAPLSGRLVDRFGQARVLVPLVLLHGAALAGLMLLAGLRAPDWTLFLAGAAGGVTGVSLGSMVRARWSHLLGDDPRRLHTAFSFESVADEVVFVTGPILVTGLTTLVHPYAGLTLTAALAVLGTIAFALQRGTEPPVRPRPERGGSPITVPGIALLSCVFLTMGAVFGSVDLITVAFAEANGARGVSGLLLAAFAGGSMVSGLWYGGRPWRISLRSRFVRCLAVFAAGLAPTLAVGGNAAMAAALFLAGMAISPTIITGFALVERLAPPHMLTEGMAWISTSLGFGIAVGSWAGGRLTEAVGPSGAYVFPFACGLLAMAIGLAGSGRLRVPETPAAA